MGKKQPAHEIKLGKIRVAIWANEAEDQSVWFNAVVTRLYKSGNRWIGTTTLRHDDLPVAMQAISMAYGWIWQKQSEVQPNKLGANSKELAVVGR